MNAIRRKALNDIMERLAEIREDLAAVVEEEEGCRDNIPESLQSTERYERMEEVCDTLNEALDSIDEALNGIEEAAE